MLARVTVTQGPPERAEEVIRLVKEHIVPAAKKGKGFKGGYWLADRAEGKGLAVTFWTNAAAEQASAPSAAELRAQAATAGAETQSVEVYEVIGQASPAGTRRAQPTVRGRRVRRVSQRRPGRRKRS
jgi:heme-degrading monooxygenase HmoA